MEACQVFYSDLNLPFALYTKFPFAIAAVVFFIGLFFLIKYLKKDSKISAIHSFALTLLVFALYSNDFVLWRSFFYPIFLLSIVSDSKFLIRLASTVVWCVTAGSLSFFGAFLVFLLAKGKDFYILILGLLGTFYSAKLDLLDYSENANFSSLGSRLYNLREIYGLSYKFNFINDSNYLELSRVYACAILLPAILYLFFFLKNDYRKYFTLILFLSFNFVYLTIYRFIPGVALYPLSWDLFLILLVSLVFILINYIKNVQLYALAPLVIVCLFCSFFTKQNIRCIKTFSNENTPSNFVTKYWQEIENKEYHKIENVRLVEPIKEILDSNPKTRWSIKSAQKGGEQLSLELENSIKLSKIKLNLGEFVTDFPRGLKVELESSGGVRNIVFDKKVWIGPIKFTKLGYAYFGNQADVEIAFKQSFDVKKLILTQIGKDANYDWSIAELEFYEVN